MSAVPQRRRDLGRILDDAFAAYRLHWRALVPVALAIVVPVQLGVLGIGAGWLTKGYDSGSQVGANVASSLAQLLVVAPLVTAATVHVLLLSDRGERRRAGWPALQAALESFGRLFWAVLLAALVTALGTFAFVVPGLIIAVRSALVPQAVVLDGERGATALRRSWALVSGRWWWTFGALLVAEVIVSVASAALTVPASYLAQAVDAEAVQLAATIAAEAITLPMLALITTMVYFALASPEPERTVSDFSTPPPEPTSEAWEQRRREGWRPPAQGDDAKG